MLPCVRSSCELCSGGIRRRGECGAMFGISDGCVPANTSLPLPRTSPPPTPTQPHPPAPPPMPSVSVTVARANHTSSRSSAEASVFSPLTEPYPVCVPSCFVWGEHSLIKRTSHPGAVWFTYRMADLAVTAVIKGEAA